MIIEIELWKKMFNTKVYQVVYYIEMTFMWPWRIPRRSTSNS